MRALIPFWSILTKDMKNYYLKPPNISWGIIFPFAWMLMMFLKTKTAFNIEEVFPGIVAMSILFGTTSMLAVTITFERKSRSFERLLLAPISVESLVFAKISGAILFGMFNSLIPVLVSVFYFKLNIIHSFSLISGIILLSVVSTLLGLYISVAAKEVFEAQTYSNFFRFPMIFLCGLFVPVLSLPIFIRPLSFLLPITYGVDLLRNSVTQTHIFLPLINIVILIGFISLLFSLSIYNIRKKWIL